MLYILNSMHFSYKKLSMGCIVTLLYLVSTMLNFAVMLNITLLQSLNDILLIRNFTVLRTVTLIDVQDIVSLLSSRFYVFTRGALAGRPVSLGTNHWTLDHMIFAYSPVLQCCT